MALVLGLSLLVGIVTAGTVWLFWSLLERMVAARSRKGEPVDAGKGTQSG